MCGLLRRTLKPHNVNSLNGCCAVIPGDQTAAAPQRPSARWPLGRRVLGCLLGLLLAMTNLGLISALAWPQPALALSWPQHRADPGAADPLALRGPSGRLQETAPPVVVQQLQNALEERQPRLEIVSPRDDTLLPDGPWQLSLRLHDWPLVNAGPLGLGTHLVVQLDDQPPVRISTGEADAPLVVAMPALTPGSHRITAYAARPWGEAVKSPGAIRQIRVHRVAANPLALPAPGSPQLLAVSPADLSAGEPVLLDWILLDAPLQNLRPDDGSWRLRVSINGDSFVVDQNVPLWLRGWRSGSNSLQLELLDGKGGALNPPFNSLVQAVELPTNATRPRWLGGRLSERELGQLLGTLPVEPEAPDVALAEAEIEDGETTAPEAAPVEPTESNAPQSDGAEPDGDGGPEPETGGDDPIAAAASATGAEAPVTEEDVTETEVSGEDVTGEVITEEDVTEAPVQEEAVQEETVQEEAETETPVAEETAQEHQAEGDNSSMAVPTDNNKNTAPALAVPEIAPEIAPDRVAPKANVNPLDQATLEPAAVEPEPNQETVGVELENAPSEAQATIPVPMGALPAEQPPMPENLDQDRPEPPAEAVGSDTIVATSPDLPEADPEPVREPEPQAATAPSLSLQAPERISSSTPLGGSAREQVNPDGSLIQPPGRGPLARLKQLMGS